LSALTCFKAYDIRGELGVNLDAKIAYDIGCAVATHFGARAIVLGRDARESSPELAEAVARGVCDAGSDVLDIGLAGTEEMYWAVSAFGACAGVEVTASHNPINYNGMKIVKSGSQPLDDALDFEVIRALASAAEWYPGVALGKVRDISAEARDAYVEKVLNFVDTSALKPLKMVINSGNGAAGPTVNAVLERLASLGVALDVVRVNHEPDHTFPNGIPNPLLPENHAATASVVKAEGADFGVAFDGDFDRCFFFEDGGKFVSGEYVVGLLAEKFLKIEAGAKIVHDPRVIWNTQDVIETYGGEPVMAKTGHAFIKQAMRERGAVYGGEISAHHYFRDFAYCDSGIIPWLLVWELLSKGGETLGDYVARRESLFPSSGERNFRVHDANERLSDILARFEAVAVLDEMDGLSFSTDAWRFNVRKSNTEPLVRLNAEAHNPKVLVSILDDLVEHFQS
jgi:phosphomannomutase